MTLEFLPIETFSILEYIKKSLKVLGDIYFRILYLVSWEPYLKEYFNFYYSKEKYIIYLVTEIVIDGNKY